MELRHENRPYFWYCTCIAVIDGFCPVTAWLMPVLLVGLASGARVFFPSEYSAYLPTIIGYHSLASPYHPTLAQEGGGRGEGPCCAFLFPTPLHTAMDIHKAVVVELGDEGTWGTHLQLPPPKPLEKMRQAASLSPRTPFAPRTHTHTTLYNTLSCVIGRSTQPPPRAPPSPAR